MFWDLARGDEFLPDFSLTELKQRVKAEKRVRSRLRLQVALNRKQGDSIDRIADAVGLHRRSVQDILHRFQDRGISAADALPKPGRPKHLTAKQLERLRNRLLQPPQKSDFREGFWTSKMVLSLVRKKYKVNYTREHMTQVLKKLGFSYKKPRPMNARKAPPREIRAFKKTPAERYWLPPERAG